MRSRMKRVLFLVISMLTAVSLFSFVKHIVFNESADNFIAKEPPPEMMCYDIVEVEEKELELKELQDQLSKLEQLYADKKIDESTYKTRKNDLLEQIDCYSLRGVK